MLWLPLSSHALLESAGLIHQDTADGSDDDHDAADGICLIESGGFHVEKGCQSGEFCLAQFLSDVSVWVVVDATPPQSKPDIPGTAPPLLTQSWQFSSRASLPARAPSIAS